MYSDKTEQTQKPLQRLSYKEKVADDNKWGKENIHYFIAQSSFPDSVLPKQGQRDLPLLYSVYNGKLPDHYFNYVINPYNTQDKQYANFPARIRAYPIIRPNIDLLYGEFTNRPHVYSIENIGETAYNSFLEKKKALLQSNLEQHFVNELAKAGHSQDQQQVATPPEILAQFSSNYSDLQAIKAQKKINDMENDADIRRSILKMFKDWLITGETYSYKNISYGEFEYQKVSPLELDYDKSPDVDFIEDGSWVTRKRMVVLSDIIDKFRTELEEENYVSLENAKSGNGYYQTNMYQYFVENARENNKNKIEWIHVAWKSQVKVGILSYPDPLTGQMQQMQVDEDYPVDKEAGETVVWEWDNQWWEGHRLDGTIIVGVKPIDVQRNAINNFSKCKGPYNGARFSDTHSINISPLELGLPFEINHYILKYRLELTIAKNKGKIALLDVNTIPNKPGWSEDKFLYYTEAMGWGFLDRSSIKVDKTWNQYTVLDMDLLTHIDKMQQLIEMNKAELDEVMGINRQRKGEIQASDGVGNTNQGIFQSSLISDIIFSKFDDFVNSEYQGFLDYSKFLSGKKTLYRDGDLTQALDDAGNGDEDYMASNLNLKAVNSSAHTEKLKQLKALAQAFTQNEGKPSTIAEIIDSDNMAKIKQILKQAEESEQQLAQSQAQSEQAAEQEKIHIQEQYEQIKHDMLLDIQEHKYDREEDLAYINGDIELAKVGMMDGDGDSIPDINEIEARALDREKHINEIGIKRQELALKHKELTDKREIAATKSKDERYKADKTLEVARISKANKPPSSK